MNGINVKIVLINKFLLYMFFKKQIRFMLVFNRTKSSSPSRHSLESLETTRRRDRERERERARNKQFMKKC